MKKLKQILTGITFIFVISLILNCQVKAQEAYDLNGNKVDVITYAGGYEKTTGYRFISSEESGTIAYFDNNGNLIRLVNRATKEIIIDNENTVSEKATEESTTKFSENVTLKKVTGLKKKTVFKKYRPFKNSKEKIQYKYGLKISWKKLSNVTGYEVYRYEVAKKCWTKIKTTKKNSCILTGLLSGSHVKLKVRTYKNVSVEKEYGKYSKVYNITVKDTYGKKKIGGDYKEFYDKYASEETFIIQNNYRKLAGVPELKWNDVIYEAAKRRCYDMYTKEYFSHENFRDNIYDVFIQNKADDKSAKLLSLLSGENIAGSFNTPKKVMKAWKSSAGHYSNIIDADFTIGAIACICNSDSGRIWSSIFIDTRQNASTHKSNDGECYTVDYSFLY